MASRRDSACMAKESQQQLYRELVKIFSPRLFFDPQERFFPVDLLSTFKSSSLWLVDPSAPFESQKSTMLKAAGEIDLIADLSNASEYNYLTVAGTGEAECKFQDSSFNVPVPRIDKVYELYSQGIIPSELTIYASVCQASQAINSKLIIQPNCEAGDQEVFNAIAEHGLLLNYYFYFPAYESPEIQTEGDWSGITLLLKKPKVDSSGNIVRPEDLPILACYYQKSTPWPWAHKWDPSIKFWAENKVFRRWDQITKDIDGETGLATHPFVYVSLGRHNCYFEPTTTSVGITDYSPFTTDSIENGQLSPGPSDRTITGSQDWYSTPMAVMYALCPVIYLIAICANGCEPPIQFDPEISLNESGEDQVKEGGYVGGASPAGSIYPKKTAENQPVSHRSFDLKLVYVGQDGSETAHLWTYAGAWGGASVFMDLLPDGTVRNYGFYRGVRRPILSAWFLWDLFTNWQYGCAGTVMEPEPS